MRNKEYVQIYLPVLFAGLFFLLPMVFVLLASIFGSPYVKTWSRPDLRTFQSIFLETNLKNSLLNSVLIALVSSALGILLALLYLSGIKLKNGIQKKWHLRVLSIPIFLPDVLWGLSLLFILKMLNVSTGVIPVILVHIIFNSFLSYLIIKQSIMGYPDSQINSAKIFGLSGYEILLEVILPNIKAQVAGCLLLCFLYSFDDFLLTFLLSGSNFQTFPLYIYSKLKFGLSQDVVASTAIYTLVNILIFFLLYKFSALAQPGEIGAKL